MWHLVPFQLLKHLLQFLQSQVAGNPQVAVQSLMAMAVKSLAAAPGFLSQLPGEPPNNVRNCCLKSWQSE
jgi:hypothetical protein